MLRAEISIGVAVVANSAIIAVEISTVVRALPATRTMMMMYKSGYSIEDH